jgi:antitoxin component YwqK of YwqJK toxin-antitoxin module
LYLSGLRTGVWRAWWPSGGLRAEGSFLEGEPHGWWVFWYAGGVKRAEGELRDGRHGGPWRFWYGDGSLDEVSTGIYWDDVLSSGFQPREKG